jgi:hypothetical protein
MKSRDHRNGMKVRLPTHSFAEDSVWLDGVEVESAEHPPAMIVAIAWRCRVAAIKARMRV